MKSHLDHTDVEMTWRAQHLAIAPVEHRLAVVERATPSSFSVHGKDISSYQPVGGFGEGGRRFGIAKASEGVAYADPHFAGNRQAAADEVMAAFGIYDFARPARNSSHDEFAKFASVVGAPRAGEFAVLDYEVPPWNQAWACEWADEAHAAGFAKVVFYSYAGMLASNPTDQLVGHFDDLWVAAYGCTIPHGDRWTRGPYGWAFHQHTDGQSSVGCNDGSTDCSAFYGSLDDLRAWIGQPAPNPQEDWFSMATEADLAQAVNDGLAQLKKDLLFPMNDKLDKLTAPTKAPALFIFDDGTTQYLSDMVNYKRPIVGGATFTALVKAGVVDLGKIDQADIDALPSGK